MSGRKLDDAKRAARTFIELLDLQHNQAALVGFAREAQLGAGLTHDHAALESAIEALAPSHGSFVAEGIRLATAELLGERHHPQAAPVLILLTDGNADDVNEVRKVARNARAQNIQVIAVGFGKTVNATLLRNIVSSPSDFHQTSSSDDLAAIYAEIATVIDRCPAVGDLLPPTSMPLPSPTPTVLPETDLKPDEET
jgi:Mg-chelatase subunit ChlD